MTAYCRVITIGKNSDMPKMVKLPWGVTVNGAALLHSATVHDDEIVCPDCEGWGCDHFGDTCERCNGQHLITIEQEPVAAMCLPSAAVGRPVTGTVTGRPTPSGMTLDALAADEQLRTRSKTHTVLRSGLKPPALQSPALPPAHRDAPGSLTLEAVIDGATVIAGMAVFSAIAWFFLVLS